ncbi:GlxA family transcriptional regulator [Cupriavidus taiwanensis]|uniref:Putative transcriptional regulator, AraC family n=1 Tax=Cupriavidus taiwanensis TaxID=164546 RepID=A0A7Z7NQ85_9BURK|nr:helix-turn-helix domain-containing protein [Cupriavidus taiwanensis]SOZ10086.1 putative transcriptional regulator, AraC family [Cupriavidus taiwanensis]SOZ12254.1 putative transcriptional regulator, AraC family [Cupriavidus taiwanensis]SOZ43559.1 putative transcriptional regulator, AraC family [Cupriavidus taiwanensis]SPC22801.1 putative transcriptional regulator, AraC family [Cupriavidus taiwanensis]SPD54311.1 putative transcriptional regulator, AraC family [Cupriavidus taiwanensis]
MHTVAVIAFEGISPFHLSVPCIVFGDDLDRLGVPRYRLLICGEKPGLISTMSGFRIEVEHNLSVLEQADTVIMPAWRDPAERAPQALLDALRCASARGARIAGLCLGTFVVAEAGLLDGRTAATHWAWADDFAQRYPRVRLDRDSLYIDDGAILTSAGTAAALDCCLHLVRRDHGAEVANRVARRMVVAPHRHGGQAQYIEHPLPQADGADRLGMTLDWAIAHLSEPLTLDTLAEKAGMSRRNFTRRFKEKTGTTVTQWVLNHRLTAARRLLETTDKGVDLVAELVGFGSAVSLRQHFTQALAVSPSAYRRQFGTAVPRHTVR